MKKFFSYIFYYFEKFLASCAFIFAKVAANTSCSFPYYEPEQPKELERLKKHRA